MTQETKLEIIGPYTPEHEGPFCTRDCQPVILKVKDGRGLYPLAGYIGDYQSLDGWTKTGMFAVDQDYEDELDLMNAREVPVAREFWVNEYAEMSGDGFWFNVFSDKSTAKHCKTDTYIRTIHVREVLPGDNQ